MTVATAAAAAANSAEDFPEDVKEMMARTRKNPISLFLEMYMQIFKESPKVFVQLIPGETKGAFMFAASVRIGDIEMTGFPHRTKKVAKMDCFVKGIKILCEQFSMEIAKGSMDIEFKQETTFFELLRKHTYSKFYKLSSSQPESILSDKVIASIFLITRNNQSSSADIISLATGNKGLRGDCLSLHGCSVNDCHAEVIARRGLLRFLYAQVLLYAKDPSKSIFVKNNSTGKLALRKGLSFHMFVNTAPCGDARVYSLNDITFANAKEVETNSLLRFKVENGMGTVLGRFPETLVPQTIDGVMGGERLRTMSCSDKMLRWNVLGLQGGLLSLFTDPIYLSSLAVADKSDTKRLERALYQRIDGFKPPAPFHLNKPLIGKCQDEPNTREATTGSPISVNWNLADNSVEVLRTSLGLIDVPSAEKQVSRLSKKDMSMLFKKVCEAVGSPVPNGFTYENLKVHCKSHYQAKLALEAWLREHKLGMWQSKPEEVSMFTV